MSGKIAWFVVLCMVLIAHDAEGLACGQVINCVSSCLGYLRNTAPLGNCCNGVKTLANAARTTADRQTACNCLKETASTIKGINFSKAADLPATCGVNIPYKISPSTDCTKVR